jgi:hypothetical protein
MLSEAVSENERIREEEEKKREEFAKKRKAHYNEFRVIKGTEKSTEPGENGNKDP